MCVVEKSEKSSTHGAGKFHFRRPPIIFVLHLLWSPPQDCNWINDKAVYIGSCTWILGIQEDNHLTGKLVFHTTLFICVKAYYIGYPKAF